MKSPFQAALISGSTASLTSTLALGVCGARESGSIAGPINGPSQWLWGEAEGYSKELTWRHTATGYVIHHSMSVLWANVYEQMQRRSDSDSILTTCMNAGITATLGYIVDYEIAPRRLRPGFKKHLGARSIFAVYAAFAAGLALSSLLRSERRNHDIEQGADDLGTLHMAHELRSLRGASFEDRLEVDLP
jgi:hypothetical protein